MKDFDWSSFTRRIAIKASVSEIYDAWTVSSELEKWFLRKAHYFTNEEEPIDVKLNAKKGNAYKWFWYLYDYIGDGILLDENGRDNLKFTFEGCVVEVKLKTERGWTIVELTQCDIPEDDDSKKNIRLGCESGWSFYLVNLKSVYEGGVDLRNRDSKLSPMLNN